MNRRYTVAVTSVVVAAACVLIISNALESNVSVQVKQLLIQADAAVIKIEPQEDGNRTLCVIEPDPTEFKIMTSAELIDKGESQNRIFVVIKQVPIALSDGKLINRDLVHMKCFKVAE